MTGDLIFIFTAAFLGSIHCVGMCGGLISACALRHGKGVGFSIEYNAGRVFTYLAIGATMGLAGGALANTGFFSGFSTVLSFIAGVFMVYIGIDMLGLAPARLKSILGRVRPAGFLFSNGKRPVFLIGMANGLIPCGLVYAVALNAASTGSAMEGVSVMAALGAGTFLPLFAAGIAAGLPRFRTALFLKASSVIIIALGVKTIAFGAGAGHAALHLFH